MPLKTIQCIQKLNWYLTYQLSTKRVSIINSLISLTSRLGQGLLFTQISGQSPIVNTSRLRQKGSHFAEDTLKRIFLNENVRISLKISLKFVHKGQINNIPALVQIMALGLVGTKPSSETIWLDCQRIYASLSLNELIHMIREVSPIMSSRQVDTVIPFLLCESIISPRIYAHPILVLCCTLDNKVYTLHCETLYTNQHLDHSATTTELM